MNSLTLLNITASTGKFSFVYIFTMLFVSGVAYCSVIYYQKKYEGYKNKIDPETGEFDDVCVSRYSLFVKNLPKNMG